MQSQQKLLALVAILQILVTPRGANGTAPSTSPSQSQSSPLANWRFSDPHYTSAQYAKILGDSGVGRDKDDNGLGLGALQIQYVDYQPHCLPGGVPVCATNGTDHFYFENDCRLEAHNLKMLFQHGTELEATELERCVPPCHAMKCTQVKRPVCALAEIGGASPQTFANECEMRRRECHTKQVHRIKHEGPCENPTKTPRKKKQRRYRNRKIGATTSPISKLDNEPQKFYILLTTTPRTIRTIRTTRTTGTTTPGTYRATNPPETTTPTPMQFHELRNMENPMVSVSRAVDAYNVYNIPDVGHDYGEITDSSLSMFLPEVGRVTDAYSKTTTTSAPEDRNYLTTNRIPEIEITTKSLRENIGNSWRETSTNSWREATTNSWRETTEPMPSTTEQTSLEDAENVSHAISTTQESLLKSP
ncbi:hypothetical protein KR009_001112 [Drosophila setifemur]|nr:hypothetical protein KR009_001112 [Drosophila setifemur]